MRTLRTPARLSLALCGCLVLSACGGGLSNSWVNPVNWFGNSRSEAIDPRRATNPLIPPPRLTERPKPVYAGQPVDQITDLRVERLPGGAVVRVTGVTDVIGYFDVRLEPDNAQGDPVDGVLGYTLRAVRPARTVGVGGAAARTVNAAVSLTDQQLSGVRQIIVRGARNQRTTRR